MKILVTRKIPSVAIDFLRQNGFEILINNKNRPLSRDELIRKSKDADGIVALLTDKFDKDVINKLTRCKVIANYAVGFNNIDIDYAKKKGIVVTNTPDVLTDSTADLTMTLVLSCARRVIEGHSMIIKRKFKGWQPELLLGMELKNKTFGIIGAGRIGNAVAQRAKAFGCSIIYFSDIANKKMENEITAKRVSLEKLLMNADIISVHLPLNSKTKYMLNAERLSLLKSSAILINTSRGEVIEEKALIKLLKENKIFAAGLDVFENEPNINPKLSALNNVVLLPHIGSATIEARNAMAMLAAKNIAAVLSGKKPLTPVN
ncbi:MAG: D-glycerate dehydrogenase [Ignavibacteriales bacterium]|nr:MAG: D-glycerate dehydrogenase [Ignavibacteriales bacterium]